MPARILSPLLTLELQNALRASAQAGATAFECSLDLGRTSVTVSLHAGGWQWQGADYPFLDDCREHTVYYWHDGAFAPVARFTEALVKLVPTVWGAPTFEIDGIKMLPTAQVSPWTDAERKVDLVRPRGRVVLDTCGGLGYFAAWCLQRQARQVVSFEKNPDVLWLRSLNPWSPVAGGALSLTNADVVEAVTTLPDAGFDAVLHDPPRFGIAGELYSLDFYEQLARVLKKKGRLFHYTGAPNRLTSGRDVRAEVTRRLQRAGFTAAVEGDGVLAVRR